VEKFVALSASGVAFGAVLSLVALGFLVLYKATGVINFAHGDLVTLGAYLAVWGSTTVGMPIVLAYALSLVVMFTLGMGLERIAYAPLRKRPPFAAVIATLAAAIAIRGGIAVWQGSNPQSLRSPVGDHVVTIAGARIAEQRLVIVAVAAVAVLAIVALFQRTGFGRSLRALAADPETARLMGVRTGRVAMVTFGLSTFLAALAGILVAPLTSVDLNFGFSLMVTAFAAAVLGGFTSLGGVVLGSLLIGLVQQLVGAYLLPDYASTLPFVLLFLVIATKPGGLVSLQRARV
jgi:branched-chain amino acid transport system permease protein